MEPAKRFKLGDPTLDHAVTTLDGKPLELVTPDPGHRFCGVGHDKETRARRLRPAFLTTVSSGKSESS